jgi:hypothetical protein
MARVEGEIIIHRPVPEVFDFVADERNEPRYNSAATGQACLDPSGIAEDRNHAAVDLYWLPLGAGGRCVRINGRIFESFSARLQRRDPCDLYHSALEVQLVADPAPIRSWRADGEASSRCPGPGSGTILTTCVI